MKRLTLDEIAKLAGVSRATVSRVVNNYPHITPEVRERVQAIIVKTGYHPNLIARSLASDRTGIIGLMIPSTSGMIFSDPFYPSLISGITQATNKLNLTLTLFLFHSKDEESRTISSILNTGLVDGLILTSDRKEDSFVPRFAARNIPFVLIGRSESNIPITYVDTNNIQGGYVGVQHLIRLGRKRIALIGSHENTAGDDRQTGYMNALQANGIEVDTDLIDYGDYSLESGYEAMKRLLKANPDAVFSTSDTMAFGALRAIREAGLRVPQDISVVGFDDLPPAVQAEPQLTTLRHPIQDLGKRAVELLHRMIGSKNAPIEHTVFPVELIIRSSCGAGSNLTPMKTLQGGDQARL